MKTYVTFITMSRSFLFRIRTVSEKIVDIIVTCVLCTVTFSESRAVI